MSVSHDEGTQKDGLLRVIRWGFWIAAVLGVYLGSYSLLMCDVPAINENGTMTHASSFRFADSISVRTPFSIAMPRET